MTEGELGYLHEKLIGVLSKGRVSKMNAAKSELSIRCPFCGDSIKNSNSAHLYIKIDEPQKGYPYFCQRCNKQGMVNSDFLSKLWISDTELAIGLSNVNKMAKKAESTSASGYRVKRINRKTKLVFPLPSSEDLAQSDFINKIRYLNNRIGKGITIEKYIEKFKVIFDIERFLIENNINSVTMTQNRYDLVKKYCIGFLSLDNSHIIFRSVDAEKTNFRYFNYCLDDTIEDSNKIYTISSKIDLYCIKPTLVLTEGIMDLISVYENVYSEDDKVNTIFMSCNGKSFNNAIRYIMENKAILTFNVKVFADGDVAPSTVKKFFKWNHLLNTSDIKLYYNKKEGEKDFGVPPERIELMEVPYNIIKSDY